MWRAGPLQMSMHPGDKEGSSVVLLMLINKGDRDQSLMPIPCGMTCLTFIWLRAFPWWNELAVNILLWVSFGTQVLPLRYNSHFRPGRWVSVQNVWNIVWSLCCGLLERYFCSMKLRMCLAWFGVWHKVGWGCLKVKSLLKKSWRSLEEPTHRGAGRRLRNARGKRPLIPSCPPFGIPDPATLYVIFLLPTTAGFLNTQSLPVHIHRYYSISSLEEFELLLNFLLCPYFFFCTA